MGSKLASVALPYMLMLVLILFVGFGSSNIDQDKAECSDQLVGLATCLPYVGGDAKTPTLDCCTGLKQVIDKSKKCLCVLIKDRDDPNLGLKINATLALQLPTACNVPLNVTRCVDLLHLAPNSTDAKVFLEFGKSTGKNISTPVGSGNSTSSGTSGDIKSDAWRGKRWVGIDMLFGTLIWIFTPHLVFYV
ncbi:non-specific lipid transfer protein GPI-anchored 6 [Ziziphus jujuba]|uniref:Non-specific lipid transfer protein GPI-anchored 6 n=1 Tax=Ziziphus jujuba TaxID=326968 RepID=A0ABM3IHP7_ZIZJJ|nr:non-specific lipid transfer protein GPI-anchored 6 [Ziziphus jujuba]